MADTTIDSDPIVAELEALLAASHRNRAAIRDLLTVVTDRLLAAAIDPSGE